MLENKLEKTDYYKILDPSRNARIFLLKNYILANVKFPAVTIFSSLIRLINIDILFLVCHKIFVSKDIFSILLSGEKYCIFADIVRQSHIMLLAVSWDFLSR